MSETINYRKKIRTSYYYNKDHSDQIPFSMLGLLWFIFIFLVPKTAWYILIPVYFILFSHTILLLLGDRYQTNKRREESIKNGTYQSIIQLADDLNGEGAFLFIAGISVSMFMVILSIYILINPTI